ncbi:MAG: transposase [Myxococcales bacterium]|nr:transposase [Myxococcales bacterium]
MTAAMELLDYAQGAALLGDTGYDSDAFVAEVRARDMRPVIAALPVRTRRRRLDRHAYASRYLVECCFHGLKRFRAVASRYEKSARNYLALVELACAWRWLT